MITSTSCIPGYEYNYTERQPAGTLAQEHASIREYDSTLYVGMVQGVSNSQYIGIGTKSRKASKTAKTRLRRAKYEIFIH